MNPAPAIVLVGGLGTRLRALYPDRPKALVPVRGEPFIALMFNWLRAHGVQRIHLAAGHLAGMVADWCAAQSDPALTHSREPQPLGTGGGLRHALDHVEGDELLVLNGDSFLPALPLRETLAAPLPAGLDGLLAVTRIDTPGRYGTVEFDDTRRLRAFLEKADRPSGGWVNGGVYRLRRAIIAALAPGTPVSLEQEVFPSLARDGRLGVVPAAPPLLDMGTPDGLRALEQWLDAHPDFLQRL